MIGQHRLEPGWSELKRKLGAGLPVRPLGPEVIVVSGVAKTTAALTGPGFMQRF